MQLRFCPACGAKLPQLSNMKFCPCCGENMAKLAAPETGSAEPSVSPTAVTAESAVGGQVRTLADVARLYDQFIADLRTQGLDETEIRRQAAEMFAKLKAQLPDRSARFSGRHIPVDRLPGIDPSNCHYSVVLKSSGDKERLTRRLSAVLRRGLLATRMAVDMVPGIISYKSKESEIKAAVAIFEDEKLHYSVLKGDFAADTPVEKLIPGFAGLDSGLQLVFRNTPTALWLGEQPCLVVPAVEMEDEPGVLVATDQGLYISGGYAVERRPEWRIIPYSRLEEVVIHYGQGGELDLIYKETGWEERLKIADGQQLERVYAQVRQALERDSQPIDR